MRCWPGSSFRFFQISKAPFEITRWSGDSDLSIDHTISFHGQSSLRAVLNPSLYSGVSLKYFPSNWLPYKYLQVSILNPEEKPIAITCRIHDWRHVKGDQAYDDRYNQKFTLVKGWNLITVPIDRVANAPKSRKMDLEKIQGLGIFVTGLSHPKVLYIDYVLLTDTAK